MRFRSLIVASITALLTLGACICVQAQQQSQSVPDAPQPQKKPAPKPESTPPSPAPATDQPAPEPKSPKNENPFPEDVSKQAAKAATGTTDSDAAQSGYSKHTADDNPFPESVSRDAAKAAGNDATPDAPKDLPPGVSSSRSSGTDETEPIGPDPARAKKDIEVGGFYLKTGNYQGALLRYKEAEASDPTNVEAIFGLAETQRLLKKNAEAARNYQLYLDIVPNGPKAKQAMKALKTLGSGV